MTNPYTELILDQLQKKCVGQILHLKKNILVLKDNLRIPDVFILDNRSEFLGVDAICVLLRRLSSLTD